MFKAAAAPNPGPAASSIDRHSGVLLPPGLTVVSGRATRQGGCGCSFAMLTISRRIILLLPIQGETRENHVLKHDFEESIGYWLVIGAQAFQRALNEELAPHGVTFRQAQVLGWLALEGEMSQNELAAKMMIEPPTLVGILDRMERDGWISRIACPSDRRKKMIVVNRAAEKVWGKIVACAKRVRARAVQGLTSEEIETLKRLVRQVQANLNEPAVVEKSA